MKTQEKEKLSERYQSIFEGFKKVLEEHDLPDLVISGIEFDAVEDQFTDNDGNHHEEGATFSAGLLDCPEGYKKSFRFDPITGRQTVICIPEN